MLESSIDGTTYKNYISKLTLHYNEVNFKTLEQRELLLSITHYFFIEKILFEQNITATCLRLSTTKNQTIVTYRNLPTDL